MAVCCSSDSVSSRFRALELREQAHVLDRDDRLVGERLEEGDLLGRERMDLGSSTDEDDAQRRALAQKRRPQHCPDGRPGLPYAGHCFRELRFGCQHVLDVDRLPVAHHPSADEAAIDWDGFSHRHWAAQRSTPRHRA